MKHQNSHINGLGAALRAAWIRSRGSISLILVWVCTGIFVLCGLLEVLGIASRSAIFSFFALSYSGVVGRLWLHQILTAPFLHGGLTHLLFNMLALWMLGVDVENYMGRRRYITFSIVCAISSMLGCLAINWGTHHITVGYSGVIYGILIAQALYFPDRKILMFWVFPMKMRHAALVLGAIALYSTATSGAGSSIAHAAHLFGGLGGLLYLRPPGWLQRLTGLAPSNQPSAGRAAPRQPSAGRATPRQPFSFQAWRRRMVYRFREWKYRISKRQK